jgi:NAD-dependent SIR2 family protein deacetylase
MRPHVLWFDEMYTGHIDYRWPAVKKACDRIGLVLAVGTSFSVGVTELVGLAANQRRAPMFIVDPSTAPAPPGLDAVHLREKAEELLPAVIAGLMSSSGPAKGGAEVTGLIDSTEVFQSGLNMRL